MKLKKRITAMMLAGAMTIGCVAGCGNSSDNSAQGSASNDSGKTYKIGCSVDDLTPFMTLCVDGAQRFADENDNVDLTIVSANSDLTTQLNNVEDFISGGYDAVIIKPYDSEGCAPIVSSCKAAGIPCVAFNNNMTAECDSYVGSDHKYSGELEAKMVAEKLGGKGKVVVLQGTMQHQAAIDRWEGVQEVLAEYPDIEIVDAQDADWLRDDALTKTEDWLNAGIEFDAIIATCAEMAVGSVLALKDAGYEPGEILVGSIDGLQESLEMMKEGWICCDVYQPADGQGYTAMETAYKLLQGESVESYVDVAYEEINEDNVDDYLALYS